MSFEILKSTDYNLRAQISRWLNDINDRIPPQSGFVDRDDSFINFINGTRTFQIFPALDSFTYWNKGAFYTKTALETVVITDVEGLHYIYYDGEILTHTVTFSESIITEFAFVAVVYWDATNNEAVIFGDERHGHIMDSATHLYNHSTFGARYGNGLALANITADGSGNDAVSAQLSVDDGSLWDEDIEHIVTDGSPQELSPISEIPMVYRSGASGDWRIITATVYPITTTGTGRAAWNEFTGGVWQLSEVASNQFTLTHYYATNDVDHPIIGIVGQSTYISVAAARLGATTEIRILALGIMDTLLPEFVPIATVIWQTSTTYTNAVKSRVRLTDDGDDYIDWRPIL